MTDLPKMEFVFVSRYFFKPYVDAILYSEYLYMGHALALICYFIIYEKFALNI